MRDSLLCVLLCFGSVAESPAESLTQTGCSSTPEAAARSAAGGGVLIPSSHGTGFRVQDVQVDAVLHRAWVRVRRCDREGAPAIFVPYLGGLPLAIGAQISGSAAPVRSDRAVVVHAGDAVRLVSGAGGLRMELEATSNQEGAVGETIVVTLKRRMNQPPEEPDHRLHGTVLADKSIAVSL